MTDTERMEELLAAERAAEWLRRLKSGGPEVHAEFGRWLRESPRNVRDILLATAYAHALKHMKSQHRVDVQAIRHRCADTVREITSSDAHPPARHHTNEAPRSSRRRTLDWGSTRNRGGWRTAAGVAFLALVSLMAVGIQAVSDRTVSTGAGEWRNVHLADGTLLRAGPRTKVRVDITERQRRLHLVQGEVMVYVARDRTRPFYIETELATARAVGTAFAVSRIEASRVSVIVEEGTVAVARGAAPHPSHAQASTSNAVTVKAGQGVSVTTDQKPLIPQTVDLRKELAWVREMLVLDQNSTVASVIHELNLRNRTQIKFLETELGQRPVRGEFVASDPSSFAKMLEQLLPLSVVEEGDMLVLVPHPNAHEGEFQEEHRGR